jgi:hypothetical protein
MWVGVFFLEKLKEFAAEVIGLPFLRQSPLKGLPVLKSQSKELTSDPVAFRSPLNTHRIFWHIPCLMLLQVGVGAFLLNDRKEVLLVQEGTGIHRGQVEPTLEPKYHTSVFRSHSKRVNIWMIDDEDL